MALGTPVSGAAAYSANGGTSVSPAYPAGILATDVVLLFTGQKPSTANGGTATTPAGWTLREELTAAGGYGTTLGADTGNTNLRVYSWDAPVAGQTGTRSVTLAQNNISWAFIVRIPTGGGTLSYGSADGQQTATPGTSMSIALTNGATATDFQAGDKAIWAMCVPTDVSTPAQFSAEAVTATGATFATATEINEPDSATGNDIGGYSAYAHVDSGSSSTAPTVTVTVGGTRTNVRGPVVLVRVREAAAPVAITLDAQPTSFSTTGNAATVTASRNVNAVAGSISYTGVDATLTYASAPKELNAEAGTFTYTGNPATFQVVRAINAVAGSYAVTGQTALTALQRVLVASSGASSLTGATASLEASRSLVAAPGSYNVTGIDVTFVVTAAMGMNLESASFNVAGNAASLVRTRVFNAETASFSITGFDASLAKGVFLEASPENYTNASYVDLGYVDPGYVGNDNPPASLTVTRNLNLESGSFSVTGSDATLAYMKMLNASSGSYSITGEQASLVYPYWPLPSQVVLGVVYGPNGDDYIGTYVDLGIKVDIGTGALIKPLSSKTAITL